MNIAAELIKNCEGCSLQAYPDPATKGDPWTIGWGCTGRSTMFGPIHEGTVWTQEQCDAELEHRLYAISKVIESACPNANANQLAAMASLAWNIGTHAFLESEVCKKMAAGDVQGAASAFLNWTHAGGKIMDGLVNRRKAERAVFLAV